MLSTAARRLAIGAWTRSASTSTGLRLLCTAHDSAETEDVELLLDAVLRAVPEYGWSDKAIMSAVSELGWSPAAKSLLPRGPIAAVEALNDRLNRKLALRLHEDMEVGTEQRKPLGIEHAHRAAHAIRTRIDMIVPWKERWPQALALQALPQNASKAVWSSAALADEVAHFAGYRSPDMRWYLDRGVMASAYHFTELYWLNDKSPGSSLTWKFLERSLQDAHHFREQTFDLSNRITNGAEAAASTFYTLIRASRRA